MRNRHCSWVIRSRLVVSIICRDVGAPQLLYHPWSRGKPASPKRDVGYLLRKFDPNILFFGLRFLTHSASDSHEASMLSVFQRFNLLSQIIF